MQESVREQQHEHGQERRDGGVHGQVGALRRPLEVSPLLGPRLPCLLAEEVEVGALLRRQQLGEAREARLARLARNLYQRLAFREILVAASK